MRVAWTGDGLRALRDRVLPSPTDASRFARKKRRRRVYLAVFTAAAVCSLALLVGFTAYDGGDGRPGRAHGAAAAAKPQASLVPIAHLASPRDGIGLRELSRLDGLLVPRGMGEAAREALGGSPDLTPSGPPSRVVDRVSRERGAFGLVPWTAVGPSVKALAVDGVSPFSPDADPGGYPLRTGTLPEAGELKRVVVAGDVVLDRGLPHTVYNLGAGPEFPLDGGYAEITARWPEASEFSETGVIHHFQAARTGEAGAVREYLRGADLLLANLENPVVDEPVWHEEGTVFNGDPSLLPVLKDAGVDGVSLANNHVMDAGPAGLSQTLAHLKGTGIRHAGAGPDLAAAQEPMIFDLGTSEVGVLSYQGVPSYEWAWATAGTPGTAPLTTQAVREDVRALEERVDVVVVLPHWGAEYRANPEPWQAEWARAAVEAGADVVVGHHAHWAQGMEVRDGRPIFYGVGNFLFDQDWSEETSTGIFAEITLKGERVLAAKPVPFVILDQAQPNFLTPEGGGDRVLEAVFEASLGPEFETPER